MTNTTMPTQNTVAAPQSNIWASFRRLVYRRRETFIIWAVLLVVIIAASFVSESFTSPRNFPNIMKQSAGLMLASLGQTVVLLIGGIDLSVGSTISLVVVLMAAFIRPDPVSMVIGVFIGLGIGTTIGLINGILITRFRFAPFMVTLATLSIVQGLALQFHQKPQATIPREFSPFFTDNLWGLPIPMLIIIAAALLLTLVLGYSTFGRRLYSVGSNENAARLSGLPVNQIKLAAYTLCGFLAGCAGVYMAARTRAGDPYVGQNFAFDSITAVILGGASLFGARGSALGTVAGVFILVILGNVMNLSGVPSNYQFILKGGLLVLAVMLYRR